MLKSSDIYPIICKQVFFFFFSFPFILSSDLQKKKKKKVGRNQEQRF